MFFLSGWAWISRVSPHYCNNKAGNPPMSIQLIFADILPESVAAAVWWASWQQTDGVAVVSGRAIRCTIKTKGNTFDTGLPAKAISYRY
jgi:hypothetical protein